MSAKQSTTATGESTRALGARDQAALSAAYSSSPLYGGGSDNEAIDDGDGSAAGSPMRAYYQSNVLDGTQNDNTLFEGGVSMDYGNAPNTADVAGSGEGGPAGPYVPTTASPGEGNGDNAASLPAVDPVPGHDGNLGSVDAPSATSEKQREFSLVNPPTLGKSPGTS